MRRGILFALLGCAAISWGLVSFTFAQTQTLAQQPPGRQSQGSSQQAQSKSPQPQPPAQQSHPTSPGKQTQRPPAIPAGYRLLTLNEGRAIARGISWADDEEGLSPDCSHLVHTLYLQAGYPYPYATSLDLYRGAPRFWRVRYAHPGDLVVWRGHVGMVINPHEHSFFSTTSSGTRIANYRSPYWRARGYPRIYRYLANTSPKTSSTTEAANRQPQH